MEKKYGDLRSGFVLLVLCLIAYFWLIPAQIKVKEDVAIGPDFFPRLMVICCGFCAVGVFLQGLRGLRKEGKLKLSTFRNSPYKVNFKAYLPHGLFLLSALAYLLVMPYAGFVFASIVFLTFLFWFFGHSKIAWNALVSVIYVAAIFLVFTYAFKISFPKGPFGF
jgi:putative tricarboxylic transport membrane protein